MVTAQASSGLDRYFYTADNKRVSTVNGGAQTIFIYGAGGEKLATVGYGVYSGYGMMSNVFFGGRLIQQSTDRIDGGQRSGTHFAADFVATDRQGAVRGSGLQHRCHADQLRRIWAIPTVGTCMRLPEMIPSISTIRKA